MKAKKPVVELSIKIGKYIPLDKSWVIRMGVLDLIHNKTQIKKFLKSEEYLSDDLLALEGAIKAWQKQKIIDIGESGTLYRFL